MPYYVILIVMLIAGLLVALAQRYRNAKRANDPAAQMNDLQKEEVFRQMLDEDENLLAVSAVYIGMDSNSYCAVTDRRIILDTKDVMTSLYHTKIKSIKYYNFSTNKTKPTNDVWYFVVKVDKKYKIMQRSDRFNKVVSSLAAAGWNG